MSWDRLCGAITSIAFVCAWAWGVVVGVESLSRCFGVSSGGWLTLVVDSEEGIWQ